jgi:hypothetical protein
MTRNLSASTRAWRSAIALTCGLAAFGLAACGHVAPYEREELTKPTMDTEGEGSEVMFRAHVQESREGATGGADTSGGGCGCN